MVAARVGADHERTVAFARRPGGEQRGFLGGESRGDGVAVHGPFDPHVGNPVAAGQAQLVVGQASEGLNEVQQQRALAVWVVLRQIVVEHLEPVEPVQCSMRGRRVAPQLVAAVKNHAAPPAPRSNVATRGASSPVRV